LSVFFGSASASKKRIEGGTIVVGSTAQGAHSVAQRVAQSRCQVGILRFRSFARHLKSFQDQCSPKGSAHARNSASAWRRTNAGNLVTRF
jgi:hypothetical protein